MKRKSAMLVAALMSFAVTLSGCGAKEIVDVNVAETTSVIEYEPCTLTFDWWGGASREKATNAAIEAFEQRYPGIVINGVSGDWGNGSWEKQKAQEYADGTNPDIQQTNFDWILKYHETEDCQLYLNLDMQKDVFDFEQYDKDMLNQTRDSKGALVGIPVSVTGRTFFWNEAVFEKAGIQIPRTMISLAESGEIFQKELGEQYYPLVLGEYDRAILMTYYEQALTGQPIIGSDGTLNFTKEQIREGLEIIQYLEDAHVIPPLSYINEEGVDSFEQSERFKNGEYAGVFEWDSAALKYLDALGTDSDCFVAGKEYADMGDYGTGVFTKVSLMFSISADCEHPKEAMLFLNYLLNDPEGVAIMGLERGIPESKTAYDTLVTQNGIDKLTSDAHIYVLRSNPMSWNPLFDDASLKDPGATYTQVFRKLSDGYDETGNVYGIDEAAEELYLAYMAVTK